MYRGLGTTYQFSTSLPLMRSFTVDMPVQAAYDDVTPEVTLLKFEPLLGPEAN